MTLLQFAGALIPVVMLPSLPAAATTTEPASTAASMALCRVWLQATPDLPPAPIRITLAGLALAGGAGGRCHSQAGGPQNRVCDVGHRAAAASQRADRQYLDVPADARNSSRVIGGGSDHAGGVSTVPRAGAAARCPGWACCRCREGWLCRRADTASPGSAGLLSRPLPSLDDRVRRQAQRIRGNEVIACQKTTGRGVSRQHCISVEVRMIDNPSVD